MGEHPCQGLVVGCLLGGRAGLWVGGTSLGGQVELLEAQGSQGMGSTQALVALCGGG